MATPPETNSASTTRMRKPSRTVRVLTSIGVDDVRQAEHVDRQPGRQEILIAVPLLDHEGEQPNDDAAVQRRRIPRPVGGPGGHEGILVAREKGLICHGFRHEAAKHDGFCALKSRVRGA